MKQKGRNEIIFLSGILVFGISFFLIFGSNNKLRNLNKTHTNAPLQNNNLSDVEIGIKNMFAGNVIYQKDKYNVSNIESYFSTYDFNYPGEGGFSYDITLKSYKYIKGAKFSNGYEGVEWIVYMDDWLNYLKSLKAGRQTLSYFYSEYGDSRKIKLFETGITRQEVEYRKIGNHYYEIRDRGIAPNGSAKRRYTTFDDTLNQIIIVEFGSYKSSLIRNNANGMYDFDEQNKELLKSVEKILL